MKKINLFFIAAVSMSMLIACSGKNGEQTTVVEKVESVKIAAFGAYMLHNIFLYGCSYSHACACFLLPLCKMGCLVG